VSGPGGVSPPGSRRTVLEPLDSYGSHYPTAGQSPNICRTASPGSSAPPLVGLPVKTGWITQPLRSTRFHGLHRYYGLLRPCASHRYFHPRGSSTWAFPFSSRRQVPTFPIRAWIKFTPPLCRTPPKPVNRLPLGLSQAKETGLVLTSLMTFRHVISGSLAFVSSILACRSLAATFPATLTTQAFDLSSLGRLEAWPCSPASRGLPSSLMQHRTLLLTFVRGTLSFGHETRASAPPTSSAISPVMIDCRLRFMSRFRASRSSRAFLEAASIAFIRAANSAAWLSRKMR